MFGKKLFCYVIRSSASILAGATDNKIVNIANDYDFELKEIRTTGTNNLRATLKDTNGELFSNQSINLGLVGSGLNGYKIFDSVIIPANTQIECLFDNQTGGAISAAQEIQLWGYKIPR